MSKRRSPFGGKCSKPDHPHFVKGFAALAALQYLSGEPLEAHESIQRAIASARKLYGPKHSMLADLLNSDAVILDRLKRKREAKKRAAGGQPDPRRPARGVRPDHLERARSAGPGQRGVPALEVRPIRRNPSQQDENQPGATSRYVALTAGDTLLKKTRPFICNQLCASGRVWALLSCVAWSASGRVERSRRQVEQTTATTEKRPAHARRTVQTSTRPDHVPARIRPPGRRSRDAQRAARWL